MFDEDIATHASLKEQVEDLRLGLITRATGGSYDNDRYQAIRAARLRTVAKARLCPNGSDDAAR